MDGYELILRHKGLSVVSFPYQRCFQAFKDAALLVLNIQKALMNEGLTLHDPTRNIVFNSCRPIYANLCSSDRCLKGKDGKMPVLNVSVTF